MLRPVLAVLSACAMLTLWGSTCSATIVLEWGNGTSQGGEHNMTDVPGEQLELATSQAINNLTFSWGQRVSSPGTFARVAFGDVFLLTSAYTGTPSALSSSTTGFVAEATAASITTDSSGSYWKFASNVTLQPNTLYYFYSDSTPTGTLYYTNNDYTSTSANPNEARYHADSTSSAFGLDSATSNNYFELTGQAVPEPSTLLPALLTGIVSIGYARRRSLKARSA